MNRRLTDTHPLYGLAGLIYPPEQVNFVPYNDKDLFEFVEKEDWYTRVSVVFINEEFEYLTFDQRELITIVMKYTEPGNRKLLKFFEVEALRSSVNSVVMLEAMYNMATLYPFDVKLEFDSFKFTLKI
jgi:hypothetical protein